MSAATAGSTADSGASDARRRRLLIRLVAVLFAVWMAAPLAVLFVHIDHGLAVGARGRYFIGADFYDVRDQLQYMAWIRDSGNHVLLSNLFDLHADPHLFLHPVFALSGLAWKLGASLQLSFLAWQPVWAFVLFGGFAAYVRRTVPTAGAQATALVLALFMFAPASWLFAWLHLGNASDQFGTLVMGLEMFPAAYLTGAGAIAVGLMPLVLLGIERIADPEKRRPGRSARWYGAWSAAAGLLVSWLHPWQGLTLLVIAGGLVLWERRWTLVIGLAPILLAVAAPLFYFFVLSHTNSAWRVVAQPNNFSHVGVWFVAALAPLLLIAAPGLRPARWDTGERLLRLWPLGALVVYFALHSSWIYHAFVAISLPVAVLAVNGWRRLGLRWPLATLGVITLTAPGVFFYLQQLHREAPDHFLASGEARALHYLEVSRTGGGVLAREPLGSAVPAFSGRRTWVGHSTWTPNFVARDPQADALYSGRLDSRQARALVRASGARYLLADCKARADLRALLGSMVATTSRFGCATVYRVY